MSRITETFAALRARGEKALVAFITAGDPDLETTEALLLSLAESGADLIELGVPFSDPTAEGPIIQRASERALAQGTSLRKILDLVAGVRDRIDVPILLMGYANPVHAMGAVPFAETAARAGVDGVILPDLPFEEGEVYYRACRDHGIDAVLLAAPTTSSARLPLLVERTAGFLYYVSLQGVTGLRDELTRGISEKVVAIRKHGEIPVCVGFGISTPEQAREVGLCADGIVVGSAFVSAIEASGSREEAVDAVSRLAFELKRAIA